MKTVASAIKAACTMSANHPSIVGRSERAQKGRAGRGKKTDTAAKMPAVTKWRMCR